MSVRAHPVKLDYKNIEETFNLWHDAQFVDVLDSLDMLRYTDDGGGHICIDEYELERIREYIKENNITTDERTKEIMKDIEENIKEDKTHYICF